MLGIERIIDADCHVVEPGDLWEKYIEPRFRDRAPRPPPSPFPGAAAPEPGKPNLAEPVLHNGEKINHRISDEVQVRSALHMVQHYREPMEAGFDAASHVKALKGIGFWRAFVYPSIGLWLFAIDSMEADLAGALVRAYNDWLFDFCRYDPTFLNGVGALNQHDPQEMVSEVRRIRGFGWKAVVIRPNPIKGRLLGHPDYEPFWAECEKLDISVGIHEGAHARVPAAGADRFQSRFAMHACSHPMEQMMGFLALVEGGVLERHPGLRVAFLEAGCGWVPYWLFRLDEEYRYLSWEVKKNVRRLPSEYFRRQCFVACEPGEPYLDRIVDFIGEDNLLFGSDYPHVDHTPGSLGELFESNAGLGAQRMRKILHDNPSRYYGTGTGETTSSDTKAGETKEEARS